MGYFRDDGPLYELVLDEAQQRQLDGLWKELDFITLAPVRQFKQFIWFERAEPPASWPPRSSTRSAPRTTTSRRERRWRSWPTVYLAKAREVTSDIALEVVRDYFDRMNAERTRAGSGEGGRRTGHLDALLAFAGGPIAGR